MASKKPITTDEVYRQLLAEDQLTEDSSCSSDEPLEETSQMNVDIDMEANQPPSVDQTLGAHNTGHAMMLRDIVNIELKARPRQNTHSIEQTPINLW
ncbi:hypothetical protein PoB_005513800 [Plakobranchus ocellatus]|uniref:Uncharacterized protein n=1 Tax=Plakobranchus ocellatus TaxID=259542 RepID=A0AAV4CCD9_9GAST|nr:hypothetical protein PoB_005513800 [Plakobranchus ocellatus]